MKPTLLNSVVKATVAAELTLLAIALYAVFEVVFVR